MANSNSEDHLPLLPTGQYSFGRRVAAGTPGAEQTTLASSSEAKAKKLKSQFAKAGRKVDLLKFKLQCEKSKVKKIENST